VGDRQAVTIEFKESAKPRIIATNNDAPAHGQFWIDAEIGAVLRSELALTNGRDELRVDATITVDYALDAGTAVWLPRSMDEHYETDTSDAAYQRPGVGVVNGPSGSAAINVTADGQATYSNIRHFRVTVGERPTQ
jgi:hypothetical protein